jgi:hypothetical protein
MLAVYVLALYLRLYVFALHVAVGLCVRVRR